MGEGTHAETEYTMGYTEDFVQLLKRRSIQTHGVNLIPYLEPGQHVLDVGCGPGNLSVGLAELVDPGELHGIDIEESQIETARAAAKAGGHDNATFHVGDALDLPFPDDRFDLVHCHAVATHVPQTQALLSEIKRVLKPGALVCCRELIGGSSFVSPHFGVLDEAWQTFNQLLAANGGHPHMGKEIKAALHEAGFTDIDAYLEFETCATEEDIAFYYSVVNQWYFSPEVIAAATKFGLATEEQFDAWSSALDAWKIHPGAISCMAWGGAIARLPGE